MGLIAKLCVGFLTILVVSTGNLGDTLAKCPTRMGSLYPPKHFSVISQRGSFKKFPENSLPAFQEALDVEGANSLEIDLSLTLDGKVILWREESPKQRPNPSIQVPTFQSFLDWAIQQGKLKLVLFKLTVRKEESHLAPILLEEIRRVISTHSPAPHFEMVFLTPHKEILTLLRKPFGEFLFSYDREIPSEEIINYHAYTTVSRAMEYKNSFSSIGFQDSLSLPLTPDPWDIYKFILTLDFKIRDNYKRSTSNYIKIISWAFNDAKRIRCLIHLGVDGIVTNNPKLVRDIALDMGKVLD